jgi:formylglycine-generating enzyme required for sulfatase activity
MLGNVWEWVDDCYYDSYDWAPTDGSAWTASDRRASDCKYRVVRGGSWFVNPRLLRSANRNWLSSDFRLSDLGFRVGRTLSARAGAITVAPGEH